ncbi:MAG: transketolase [Alphaproteobacteria bacterium HGW-Alphaproteobacteria-13]|nr:MAG: transketolase [Alphaproteobacteria bacterium HGW-Alphaproteobacteria-13]
MLSNDTQLLANAVRVLSMDAVEAAQSGHPGMPMGMADVATILFGEFLKFDPSDPAWADRDRFVLSAGHGSMLIYSLLYLTGYARPTLNDIRNFRKFGSPCAGHPENFELPGVECTTGPLGQGLAMAVGMAIAERHLNAIYGDNLVDHRTWVMAGDGCLMEGINHEAIGLAGHLRLSRFTVLWDDNRITIDGGTKLSTSEDIPARYRATGWHVVECDGHNAASIRSALRAAVEETEKPTLVRCRTIIGKGAPCKAGTHKVHGSPLGKDEIAATRAALDWQWPEFTIPDEVKTAWENIGRAAAARRSEWRARLAASDARSAFLANMDGAIDVGEAFEAALGGFDGKFGPRATRKSSELALEGLTQRYPAVVGGSADLTPSNNTQTRATGKAMVAGDFSGRYIHYGIREFGMSAAMNGMALHGGIIPYGGTFLIFSDYARAAIRLSALQAARVVYVMTHDSIGLGEDGPTHQPIEHVMSLRAMPGIEVWRPCDAIETAEAWALALARRDGPSLLALSRQNLPALREPGGEMLSARGAYMLRPAGAERKVQLLATGSEVGLAVQVADLLEARNTGADVISMPCWERFDAQDAGYRADLLPSGLRRVSIEAGVTLGWQKYIGSDGLAFGIDSFGASGPIDDLFDHFGLNAEDIAVKVVKEFNLARYC